MIHILRIHDHLLFTKKEETKFKTRKKRKKGLKKKLQLQPIFIFLFSFQQINESTIMGGAGKRSSLFLIKWLIVVSVCMFGFLMNLWKSQDATTLNATMSSLSFSSSPKTADRNTRTSQVDSSSNAVRVADAKTQKKTKEPIQQISFLGERNSGTRWLFE